MSRKPRQPDATNTDKTAKPYWFPAPIHIEEPSTFEDWIRAILARANINAAPVGREIKVLAYSSLMRGEPSSGPPVPAPSDGRGVRNILPYELVLLSKTVEETDEGRRLRAIVDWEMRSEVGDSEILDALRKASNLSPLTDRSQELLFHRLHRRTPILVDLSHDDKTLVAQFVDWLKQVRQGEKRSLAGSHDPITTETFARWNKFKVLAAHDLLAWRTLTGSKYKDSAIAAWLWPDHATDGSDEYVDRAERLRKVTKPLIKDVVSIYMMLRLERAWAKSS